MNLESVTSRYVSGLEDELRAAIPQPANTPEPLTPFYAMLRYHLGWIDEKGNPQGNGGGKRVRPILCLLACEAAGGNYRQALPLAVAIELLHNFTLIHDDIQDKSEERRHHPTVWKIWGEGQGINAGDGMHALAILTLLKLAERNVEPSLVVEANVRLNQTMVSLVEGQFLDLSFEQRMDVTLDQYMSMIERKTAVLIGCAAELGAYVGSADRDAAAKYGQFGRGMGIAFQIQDDILGIWGNTKDTGKPTGDDILQRKKTLPFLYGLQAAAGETKSRLVDAYSAKSVSDEQVREVKDILTDLGAKEYAEEQAKAHYEEALRRLEEAEPQGKAGQDLRLLASALLGRTR